MIKKIVIKKFVMSLWLILLNTHHIFAIDTADAKKIGMQVWQNESNQRKDLLVFWSEHETFPSLGIGHCIWYPKGQDAAYTEGFPLLCNYLQKNGVQLPAWLVQACITGAPWKSRDEFLLDKERTTELRNLLSSTINHQINFMIQQLEEQLPLLIAAAPQENQAVVRERFMLLRSTLLGTYALVDYLNFKGSGLNPHEESNGDRWGLLQVLLDMPNGLNEENAPRAFAVSAARMLLRLVGNSAPSYSRFKFFNGWMRRVSSYANPDILI